MKKQAFTYIEVLTSVMILALVLIPLLSLFYIGFRSNHTTELVSTATDLAAALMEEIKSKRFDENEFPDEPVAPQNLGIDSGESAANRMTFDDVDDFNGWHAAPPQLPDGTPLSDFSEFTRRVQVEYIDLSGTDWIPSSSATYFKRIIVTVSHPDIGEKTLETMVSHL